MKNYQIFVALAIVGLLFQSCAYNMKMICRPGSKQFACAHFRGEEVFVPGTNKKLASAEPSSDCIISVENKADQGVNLYMDTVWQGSLDAKSTGYIDVASGKYDHIHAISFDGQYTWEAEGGCDKNHVFKIAE